MGYDTHNFTKTASCYNVSLTLHGDPGPGESHFLLIFNGKVLIDEDWEDKSNFPKITLPLNLQDSSHRSLIANQPLIIMLSKGRAHGKISTVKLPQGKTGRGKEAPDPLVNSAHKAGAAVDLFPLYLGESEINVKVLLNPLHTGTQMNCYVEVLVSRTEEVQSPITIEDTIPLTLTLIAAHCLPNATVCTCGMEVTKLTSDPSVINFGMSLSDSTAKNIVWASVSQAGPVANTHIKCPSEDLFIPSGLHPETTKYCHSIYWNSMRRILVDRMNLSIRLQSHFVVEVAAVNKQGKVDARVRYLALVDARVMLESCQFGVTICAPLLPFIEKILPEGMGTLLDVPPPTGRSTPKHNIIEPSLITDDFGHNSYIVIRFDLSESLISKTRTIGYYDIIGNSPCAGPLESIFELEYSNRVIEQDPHDKKRLDVQWMRTEEGALAVHRELSKILPGGSVQTKQSFKRTAANNLSQNIRLMLKEFPLEINDDSQDIISSHHKACIFSVQASFAPQTRIPSLASRFAAGKARFAGDTRIATRHIETSLIIAPTHPRVLFSKALRCLECRTDSEARDYLLKSLNSQPRNRYVLWTLGGVDFNKCERRVTADAAFHIAVKGDISDGITGAIGWAALHALNHFWQNEHAAFVTAKEMRTCFEIEKFFLFENWKRFLEKWRTISGEEEIYWDPSNISSRDPFLFASAFFLCLRCFDMSEKLLECYEHGCTSRGSRFRFNLVITVDMYYIRIASLLIRNRVTKGLKLVEDAIKEYGPGAVLLQIRAVTLVLLEGWNSNCEIAMTEAESAGAKSPSFLLYQAAVGNFNVNPEAALQYAVRAYKNNSSAFIAFLIARIYSKIDDEYLAERWAAVAVDEEPILADGWAFLAILAMREQNIAKARAMLRTAEQAGPLSSDIQKEVKETMMIYKKEMLPQSISKNICFCEYY